MMTTPHKMCMICGIGILQHRIDRYDAEYKGKHCILDMQYSTCDMCGSDHTDADQLRANKLTMQAFKKEVDKEENND